MQFKSIVLSLTVLFAACANAAPLGEGNNGSVLGLLSDPVQNGASKALGNKGNVGLNPSVNLDRSPVASGVDPTVGGVLSKVQGATRGSTQIGDNRGFGQGREQSQDEGVDQA